MIALPGSIRITLGTQTWSGACSSATLSWGLEARIRLSGSGVGEQASVQSKERLPMSRSGTWIRGRAHKIVREPMWATPATPVVASHLTTVFFFDRPHPPRHRSLPDLTLSLAPSPSRSLSLTPSLFPSLLPPHLSLPPQTIPFFSSLTLLSKGKTSPAD